MSEADDILCGLANVGNTCFLNSSLQALIGTRAFVSGLRNVYEPHHRLQKRPYICGRTSNGASQALVNSLTGVVTSMAQGDQMHISPTEFVRCVGMVNPSFAGFQQQDAHELIRCVLSTVHEEASDSPSLDMLLARFKNTAQPYLTTPEQPSAQRQLAVLQLLQTINTANQRAEQLEKQFQTSFGGGGSKAKSGSKNRSRTLTSLFGLEPCALPFVSRGMVADVFQGTLLSSVTCCKCGTVSSVADRFFDLSLEIPSYGHLLDLRQIRQQELDGSSEKPQRSALVRYTSVLWFLPMLLLRPVFGLLKFVFQLIGFGPNLGNVRLQDCLAAFCMEELLSGSNRYRCATCQSLQNATKKLSFLELPEVLVTHIKRFSVGAFWGSKLSEYMEFPMDWTPTASAVTNDKGSPKTPASGNRDVFCEDSLTPLDVLPFCHKGGGKLVNNVPMPVIAQGCSTYSLYAVVVHIGGLHGGHYIAYVNKGGEWLLCDDQCVRRATREEVASCEAYLLFYRKQPRQPTPPVLLALREKARQYLKSTTPPTSSSTCYISRQWLHAMASVEEPGLILNEMCYCDAEKVEAENARGARTLPRQGVLPPHFHSTVRTFYVPIASTDWDMFVANFGGGPKIDQETFTELCNRERQWLSTCLS